jgi:DMSO/TMAO reductase YedYZ molybdopterin-dependent catalytic subunit
MNKSKTIWALLAVLTLPALLDVAAPAGAGQQVMAPAPPAPPAAPAGDKGAVAARVEPGSTAPAAAVPLRLVPLSGAALELTAADLARMPRQILKTAAPAGGAGHAEGGGQLAELEGVPLRALLDRLGVPAGHDLHGDALQLYVVAEGADGYRVVLAVAELDASFTDSVVLVADRKNGRPLDAVEGPLRLVVPADKRPARWVRQLVRISVRRAS